MVPCCREFRVDVCVVVWLAGLEIWKQVGGEEGGKQLRGKRE